MLLLFEAMDFILETQNPSSMTVAMNSQASSSIPKVRRNF
jgi:hypothetical protein